MVREAESRQKKSTKQLEIPNVEGASAIVLRSTIDHGYRNREYNYLRYPPSLTEELPISTLPRNLVR